ncbi:putative beta-D-xylosidase 7 [Carex rostrata]
MRAHRETLLLFSLLILSPLLSLSATPPFSCDPSDPSNKNYAFCNTKLPIEQRAQDLVSRLTVYEKIQQLGDIAPAIPRLGVPAYKWWSEALHGVAYGGRGSTDYTGTIKSATSFPQVILTGATFNPQLWYKIGEAIGTEARAIYNSGQLQGLTFWAPNINIYRDPRWGRGQETPGEDPLTTSTYAALFVRGVQGDSYKGNGVSLLKASACCKHFTAYDLERWGNVTRFTFNAVVTAQDLEDTYQPPFKSCVEEGHASGMMCSYNEVNGVPPCGDYNLLTKIARKEWKFYGYITSDCDAVEVMNKYDGYAKTPEDAVAYALKAGMDVNCGFYVQNYSASALQQGKLKEADMDRALRNLFTVRMRLGLFNGNPTQYKKYGSIGPNQVCSQEHQNLAMETALQGIVLLKNTDNLLPLAKPQCSSLAVIGPNADNAELLVGNYHGPPCFNITPLAALQWYIKDTRYVAGCSDAACNTSITISQAVQVASSVDNVILFMGLDQNQEREDLDRYSLLLPGAQQDLITSVANAAKKPVILVLLCGGPVDVSFAKSNPKIGAILWAGYPGQAGGPAIAQILFGEHNPGGKLPLTWYPQDFTRIPMTDMNMRANPATGYPGRTYRFYKGETVFQFGYGLSYSNYSHKFISKTENPNMKTTVNVQVTKIGSNSNYYHVDEIGLDACDKLKFPTTVRVQNHGPMEGRQPVLLFLRWPTETNGRPTKQLIGFNSVHLKAGEAAHVEFAVSPCEHFSRVTEEGKRVIDKGSHLLMVEEEELEVTVMD